MTGPTICVPLVLGRELESMLISEPHSTHTIQAHACVAMPRYRVHRNRAHGLTLDRIDIRLVYMTATHLCRIEER